MNILEQLWYGDICPVSQADYRDDEYRDMVKLLERNKAKLLASFHPAQQEAWQKIEDLREEMDQHCSRTAFISGFCLAVQLLTAAM